MYEQIVGYSSRALSTIVDIMEYGEKESERLKAAQDILNRGGMKQIQEISVTHTNNTSPSETIMEKLNQLKPREEAKDGEIVDALVENIEDGERVD